MGGIADRLLPRQRYDIRLELGENENERIINIARSVNNDGARYRTSTAVCSVGISRSDAEGGNKAGKTASLIERSIVESHIHSKTLDIDKRDL